MKTSDGIKFGPSRRASAENRARDRSPARPYGAPAQSDQEVIALPESILSLAAVLAVKQADAIVCCVDNPTARVATAFLAKTYLKPLLDLGTGIFRKTAFQRPQVNPLNRQMGADVRLILPDRCLLCFGGVAQLHRARAVFISAFPPTPDHWRAQ